MTLQARTLVTVTGLLVVAVLATVVALTWTASKQILEQTETDGLVIARLVARGAAFADQIPRDFESAIGEHMVAEATLAAHLVAVAEQANLEAGQINAQLRAITGRTALDDIWITDPSGRVSLTSHPGLELTVSNDPARNPQTSEFWPLLTGERDIVVQEFRERDLDNQVYKFVGVAGVDRPRIVLVGSPASVVELLRQQVGLTRLISDLVSSGQVAGIRVVSKHDDNSLTTLAFSALGRPDLSQELSETDAARLRAVIEQGEPDKYQDGRLLKVMAPITTLAGRLTGAVLVILPTEPVQAAISRQLVLAAAIAVSVLAVGLLASLVLARRVTRPVARLSAAAAAVEADHFDPTSLTDVAGRPDELGRLAQTFQRMAGEVHSREKRLRSAEEALRRANDELEGKVEARTGELSAALEELQMLGAVSQAVSSSLDLQRVLTTVLEHALALSNCEGGAIYEYDDAAGQFRLRVGQGFGRALSEALLTSPPQIGEGAVGRAGAAHQPAQIPDLAVDGAYQGRLKQLMLDDGFRSVLAVPLLLEDRLVGGLVVARRSPGALPARVEDLLRTFANQSGLAIQNARLFTELERRGRELEIASRHKSLFVANVSHELRTPLNAILGHTRNVIDLYIDAQSERPLPRERIRDRLQRVVDNGQDLLALINDVLDLSKMEVGLLNLRCSEFSIGEVARAVCTAMEPLASVKHLLLVLKLASDLPTCWGDEMRVAQVFRNLVHNAIKFTSAGEIRIEVAAAAEQLRITVSDTGPGIAEAFQKHIFDEFYQADSSATRNQGGTGLGLAISRRIVELHGGRIWVESTPGQGAIFTFTIPRQAVGQEA